LRWHDDVGKRRKKQRDKVGKQQKKLEVEDTMENNWELKMQREGIFLLQSAFWTTFEIVIGRL